MHFHSNSITGTGTVTDGQINLLTGTITIAGEVEVKNTLANSLFIQNDTHVPNRWWLTRVERLAKKGERLFRPGGSAISMGKY